MAFCTKCGKELRDGDRFCFYCGAPVKERNTTGTAGQAASGVQRANQNQKQPLGGGERNTKGSLAAGMDMKKIAIAAGAAVLVLLGVLVGVSVGRGKESAVQETKSQDMMDSGDIDSDTANTVKKVDSENESSGNSSGKDVILSDKSSQDDVSQDDSSKEPDADSNTQELALEVIASIEKKPRFGVGSSFEPLAVADDFNGDGVGELLAVYELKNNNNIVEVRYGLWSLQDTDAELLEEGVLFTEAGGNSGIAGIVKREDTIYLATKWSQPAGELFNNYYSYTAMSKSESSLENSWYYMESHGNYTDETKGRYILGDTAVDKSEFESKIQEFSDWVYELDILKGADGGVMTFEEMKAAF